MGGFAEWRRKVSVKSIMKAARNWREVGVAAAAVKGREKEEKEDGDESFVFGGGSAESARTREYGVHGWGRKAATIAERVLSEENNFEGSLQLYAIEVETTTRRVHVVLDELNSETGSPTLDDIVAFSRCARRRNLIHIHPYSCVCYVSSIERHAR